MTDIDKNAEIYAEFFKSVWWFCCQNVVYYSISQRQLEEYAKFYIFSRKPYESKHRFAFDHIYNEIVNPGRCLQTIDNVDYVRFVFVNDTSTDQLFFEVDRELKVR